MDEFYNPYHFVPAETADHGAEANAFRERRELEPGRRHDCYAPDHFSGRVICRILLETPVVVGQGQRPGNGGATIIDPYLFDGKPALPASSLKGMISSLLEAASASALRVMSDSDKPVSYRQSMAGALSAIGFLRERDGAWFLEPLAAPNLVCLDQANSRQAEMLNEANGEAFKEDGTERWYFASHLHCAQAGWAAIFRNWTSLKVYVGTYHEPKLDRQGHQVYKRSDLPATELVPDQDRFFQQIGGSYPESGQFYYMKEVWEGGPLAAAASNSPPYRANRKGSVIVAQAARGQSSKRRGQPYVVQAGGELMTASQWEQAGRPSDFVRGVVRVLGVGGRADSIAGTKEHELFLPYPEKIEEQREQRLVPVLPEAIEQFRALADERTLSQDPDDVESPAQWLPFTPFENGAVRADDRRNIRHRRNNYSGVDLRDGQLVYFDIATKDDGSPVVSKISFSAIWRNAVTLDGPDGSRRMASLQDFFDAEQRPMNPARKSISPAEWLFGFVGAAGERKHRDAYRGRLRFSLAKPAWSEGIGADDWYAAPQDGHVLRELSSPKPPSPAMYFTPTTKKERLRVGTQQPLGRKVYLHKGKRLAADQERPWRSERPGTGDHRKLAVRPLSPQAIKQAGGLWFHVDFDNLSESELNLLCYALRPSQAFRHKIGLGKPLGLGSIEIEPVALLRIARDARYGRDDLFASPRYHTCWRTEDSGNAYACLRLVYPLEAKAWEATDQREEEIGPIERAGCYRKTIEGTARLAAIELLGDPNKLNGPQSVLVHTPLRKSQQDPEDKTYEWHAANEKGKGKPQGLRPITAKTTAMPPLRRN